MNYLIIHLSREEVVAARFAVRRGEFLFVEAARHARPGEDLPPLLAGLAPRRKDERVVLAMPPHLIFFRRLQLPIGDRRRLREVVPQELAGETALESDAMLFDALPLADGGVLAVWCEQRVLAEQIRLLTEQGLEPEVVTVAPCHWQFLFGSSGMTGNLAVTDGEALSFFQDGGLAFCRSLPAEDSAGEVMRTLALLEMGKGVHVDRLVLHGDAARNDERFVREERETLLLPTADLPGSFDGDGAARDLAGALAAVVAVDKREAIDLRTGPLAYTAGKMQLRRRLKISAFLAAALVVLLFVEAGVRYYLVRRDLAALNTSVAALYREVFPTRKKAVDEVGELKSEIKRLGSGESAGGVLALLRKIAEAKPDEVTGIYDAEIEGDQVRLKGDARSIQAVQDFRTRLVGAFPAAEVGEIKSRPDGTVSFVFRGSLTEGRK